MTAIQQKTIGIVLFPEVEVLDFCGPFEVFSVTRLIEWIRQRAKKVETVASVCTGSLLLGQAGLLDGRRATTHWVALSLLRERFPKVNVVDDQHVVEEKNILTSAGISAGIDLALRVVARYFGEEVARYTARYMEYPYPESNARRVQVGAGVPGQPAAGGLG